MISHRTSQTDDNPSLFESIANDIATKGFSINPAALPLDLTHLLAQHITTMPDTHFKRAGIGRTTEHRVNDFVRTDAICWINGDSDAEIGWLNWARSLQAFLNRRLLLGLFSFESHFAHYAKGDFYKKHKDAFTGEGNRVLTVIVYLNEHWSTEDGGELVIYQNQQSTSAVIDDNTASVTLGFGTLVVFLSEGFPHEVLAAQRDRYSIAGWFRLNCSIDNNIDPPR
ncbi:2OG-Fe(II) oxygenase [Shewanella canadensis]|uniref:2OG-Fe(II) oxygenase n=1 Tax=Shewanella canadensis TaxID=271096 RepID=A0A431WXQ2_9GAMM|nr:2OG-Fe(II) oxygenase [Shewanella canadensis]RTR40063.1 2OG-Fe(II) oxygenase [Shewanella canadensis]